MSIQKGFSFPSKATALQLPQFAAEKGFMGCRAVCGNPVLSGFADSRRPNSGKSTQLECDGKIPEKQTDVRAVSSRHLDGSP